jgi:hypothetical protein
MRHHPIPPAGHHPAGPNQPTRVVVELLNGRDARGWLAGVEAGRRIPWPVQQVRGTVGDRTVTWARDRRRWSCSGHQHHCGCPERLADQAAAARAAAVDTERRRRTPRPLSRGRGRYQVGRPEAAPWPPWATRLASAALVAAAALAAVADRLGR